MLENKVYLSASSELKENHLFKDYMWIEKWYSLNLREVLKNFLTIISHSDLKDCIIPPYYYDEYGNKVVEDFIETYFDIK